jgi:hypothetical protein
LITEAKTFVISGGWILIVRCTLGLMKDKATVTVRRTTTGEVIGEIIGDSGEVLMSRTFGHMTDAEIERVIAPFQQEHPDTLILPVKLAGN